MALLFGSALMLGACSDSLTPDSASGSASGARADAVATRERRARTEPVKRPSALSRDPKFERLLDLGADTGEAEELAAYVTTGGASAREHLLSMLDRLADDDARLAIVLEILVALCSDGTALDEVLALVGGPSGPARLRSLDVLGDGNWHVTGAQADGAFSIMSHALATGTAAERVKAAEALAARNGYGQPGVPALILACADIVPSVRIAAFDALIHLDVYLKDDAWVGCAQTLLADPDPTVRREACRELGGWGRAGPVAHALTTALDDPDVTVARAAAVALGRAGEPWDHVVDALQRRVLRPPEAVQRAARVALVNLGRGDLVPLSRLLDWTSEPGLGRVALRGLVRHERRDERCWDAFRQALADKDRYWRQDVTEMIARTPPGESRRGLLESATDDAWAGVRVAALKGLEREGPVAISVVARSLRDKDEDVRTAACEVLARLGRESAREARALLGAEDPQSRALAVHLLARVHVGGGETDWLRAALADPDASVRRTALESLAVDDDAVVPIVLPTPDVMRALTDPDAEVRAAAAGALGRGPSLDSADLPPLRVRLADDSGLVRVAAAEALLVQVGEFETAFPVLRAELTDQGFFWAATMTLLRHGADDPETMHAIAAILRSGDECVREAAVDLVGCFPTPAKSVIDELLVAASGDVPFVTECYLGQHEPRYAAAAALVEIAPSAPRVRTLLEEWGRSHDAELRSSAARLLHELDRAESGDAEVGLDERTDVGRADEGR